MANEVKVALWIVIGVLHLPTLALPWLYWRRRQYDPIRTRRPALFTQCLSICVAFVWHQVLRNSCGDALGMWFDLIIGSIILISIFETFFVFALSLYVAYNKTKEQMAMFQAMSRRTSSSPADVDAFMRSIRWSSFLLSNRFAFGWVWANTIAWMILVLAYAPPTSSFYRVSLDDFDTGRVSSPYPYTTVLVLGRNLITIICLIVTAFRLRIVQDAFGTKALLKRIGLFTTCSTTFYLLTSQSLAKASPIGIQYIINMIAADFVIMTAFLKPLLQTRRHGAVKMMTVAENSTIVAEHQGAALSDFELFLLTDDGFTAFKAHLEKEFSVENLLFWKEVVGFRTEPTPAYAWRIFDEYLSASAPLEVNLPSASLKKYRGEVFKDREGLQVSATMFDDAAAQLVRLMEVNSLARFLKTQPPSWDKFMELREEQKAMEHAGELRKTTTKGLGSLSMKTSEVEVSVRA